MFCFFSIAGEHLLGTGEEKNVINKLVNYIDRTSFCSNISPIKNKQGCHFLRYPNPTGMDNLGECFSFPFSNGRFELTKKGDDFFVEYKLFFGYNLILFGVSVSTYIWRDC